MIFNLSLLRKSAREAIQKNWIFAILITLLASLPSLCLQLAMNMTLEPLTSVIEQYRYADMTGQVLQRMLRALSQQLTPTARTLWMMVPVLFVILPFLTLGRHWFSLRILRGEKGSFSDAFARVGCFFKAIGLSVLRALLVILWGMPGVMVMLLGTYLTVTSGSASMFTTSYSIGLGLSLVLSIRAVLVYQLADIEMADKPETGILSALRHSRERMKGLKFSLLMLMFSFVGYVLLSEILTSLLSEVSYVVALVVSLALSLVISCYMEASICAFYEQVCKYRPNTEAQGTVF